MAAKRRRVGTKQDNCLRGGYQSRPVAYSWSFLNWGQSEEAGPTAGCAATGMGPALESLE